MKTKSILLSIIILFLSEITESQIPNAGFEEWDSIAGIEEPVNWDTKNVEKFISVEKVPYLTQGQYAIKVSSNGPSFEGTSSGMAKTRFKPLDIYNTLLADIKIDTIDSGKVEIILNQIEGDKINQIGYWTKDTITNGINNIEIPVDYETLDTIEILIFAHNTPVPLGSIGYSEIIVDNMNFTNISSIEEIKANDFFVFPNPSKDILSITFAVSFDGKFEIINNAGRIIKTYEIQNKVLEKLDISHLPNGIYYIKAIDNKGRVSFGKFVVER